MVFTGVGGKAVASTLFASEEVDAIVRIRTVRDLYERALPGWNQWEQSDAGRQAVCFQHQLVILSQSSKYLLTYTCASL